MSATAFLWIAVLAPLAGAAASFLVETPRRAAQLCLAFSLAALAAGLAALALYVHAGGRASESAITFWTFVPSFAGSPGNPADRSLAGAVTDFHPQVGIVVDAVSCALAVCISAVTAAAQLHAAGFLRGSAELRRQVWLIGLISAAGLGVAAAANAFTLLLAWGLGAAATYLVVHPESAERARARGARRTFVWLRVGDLSLLAATAVLWSRFAPDLAALPPAGGREISDPYNFATLAPEWHRAATGQIPGAGPRTLALLSALVIVAGAVRLALVPFCAWLADSVEASPPAVAVVQAVATTAAGGVLLLRFLPLLAETQHALTVLAALGAVTVLVAGVWALSETDALRGLGWLAAMGSGFAALALGSGGYGAGLFQLVTRSWAVAAMVLAVGNLTAAYRSRDLNDLGGSWRRLRSSSVALLAGAAAAGGLVLLGGFWSLRSVVAAVIHNSAFNGAHHPGWVQATLLIATVAGLVLMGAVSLRLALLICTGEVPRRRGFAGERLREAEGRCRVPALALAGAAAVVGFVGLPGVRQSLFRYAVLPGPGSAQPLSVAAYVVTGLACAAGLVLAALTWARSAPLVGAGAEAQRRLAALRLRLERAPAPAWVTGRLFLGPAALLGRFDDDVVGRSLAGAGRGLATGAALAGSARRRPDLTIAGAVGGVALLLALVALAAAGHLPGGGR